MKKSVVKKLTILLTAISLPTISAFAAPQKPTDCAQAVSQSELNECAGKDFDAADHELTQTYQAILTKYKDDIAFVGRLEKAQAAWLKFRDAELDAKFPLVPGQSPRVKYGSMYPTCSLSDKTQLTRQRTAQLKELLEHGPGC